MNEPEHSPLPWALVPHDNLIYSVQSNRRTIIVTSDEVSAEERDANSELIVISVNSRAALIKACEAAYERLFYMTDLQSRAACGYIEAALKLAKGEK